jgi:hypothetical protein
MTVKTNHQTAIVLTLKRLTDEIKQIKSDLGIKEREDDLKIASASGDTPAAAHSPLFGGVSYHVVIVQTVNETARTFTGRIATTVNPASVDTDDEDFNYWAIDPNITTTIPAYVPPTVSMPEVGDTVLISGTGLYSGNPLYGLFGAGGGSSATQYRYKSMEGDYYVCRAWNGTTEGSVDVYIAKPHILRKTGFNGTTYNGITYVYSSNHVARTATVAATPALTETQMVIPPYVADDIIYATQPNATGVRTTANSPVTLLDLNVDARYWARV